MSRAEEAALKAYPVINEWAGNQYGGYGDINKFSREKYLEGYRQAEKDLALTVDDIKRIDAILINGWNDSRGNVDYKEVLRRFSLERDKI